MLVRVRDRDALQVARAVALLDGCAACGRPAGSIHHVVQKGAPHHGDDDRGNLLGLCGDGSTGCHGAFHGSPYVVARLNGTSERRDAEWVCRRIGRTLLGYRRDVVEYVFEKLGEEPGRAFLERTYYIDPAEVA